MFETIGTLFTIAFWAAAILLFLFGIIACIGHLIDGNWWQRIMAVIAAILGVIVFIKMYTWCGSIAWCLLASGFVLMAVSMFGTDDGQRVSQPSPSPPQPGFITTLTDDYLQRKADEETIANAIRKAEEWK